MGKLSVRAAEANDWVRRLINGSGRYDTKLSRLHVSGVPEVGEVELSLAGEPLTTFCGPNGVGKSVLLKSIDAAINYDTPVFSMNSGIPNGTLEVSGLNGANEFTVMRDQMDVLKDGDIPQSAFMDSGSFTARLSEIWANIKDIDEVLGGVQPLELSGEDLYDARYLTCRSYRLVRMYEVDVGFSAPYFEVEYGDAKYDSRNMGLGELNALAYWWFLRRSEKNSLLLIEEPEAFLSALSQDHLSHVLAKYIVKNRLSVVISTHSGAFMNITPRASLIFLTRDPNGRVQVHKKPHRSMMKSVGIHNKVSAIVYVEDLAAKCLAKEILRHCDPDLLLRVEVHDMGGDGEVANALRPNMNLQSQIRFVAAFDGDLRGSAPGDLAESSLFLPGEVAFEAALKDLFDQDYDRACDALKDSDAQQILASLEGLNHHDWLTSLASGLERDVPHVISCLFPIWLSNQESLAASEAFCRSLRQLLR